MRPGTILTIMVLLTVPTSAGLAGEVYAEPTIDSTKLLELFLQRKCAFALGNDYHRFGPDHRYTGARGDGEQMIGTWQMDGDDLVVSAEGKGRPCDQEGIEPCDGTWVASFIWRDLKTNGARVLQVGGTDRGGLVFLCAPGVGCEKPIGTQCFPVEAVQVRPGSRRRGLYRRLVGALDKTGLGGTVVVRGPPSDRPRKNTEVWYQPGAEETARFVARAIESIVGPVAPREWDAGGPYRVTIIVGKTRATELPKRTHSRWAD